MSRIHAVPALLAALCTLAAPATVRAATPAPTLDLMFRAHVLLGEQRDVGQTPRGSRSLVRITGGTFEGPMLRGTVVPGGWDWQLHGAGGCAELHADYMLKAADGTVFNVVNHGKMCPGPDGTRTPIYSMPTFEAPLGPLTWLNGGAYVATIEGGTDAAHPAVDIAFYKVR